MDDKKDSEIASDEYSSSLEEGPTLKLKSKPRQRLTSITPKSKASVSIDDGSVSSSTSPQAEEITVSEKTESTIDLEPEIPEAEDIANASAESEEKAPVSVAPEDVSATIRSHVIAAMGVGLVPVPVLDIVGVVGIQIKLVHSLSKKYDVRFTENIAKTLIMSLMGGVLPTAVGGSLASLVKMVPGLGSVAGAAGVSVLAGGLTYAVGRTFAAHFASGGTLLDFNPKSMRGKFKEQFQKGKGVAATMEEEGVAETTEKA